MAQRADTAPILDKPTWDEFEAYLDEEWHAGQHASIFAPTGRGKSYLIRHGLLPRWTRARVMIVDVKRDKGTLGDYGRVTRGYPTALDKSHYMGRGRDDANWDEDPEHYKLQPPVHHWSPPRPGRSGHYPHADTQRTVGSALDRAFHEGNWVLVLDEAADLTDRRSPGLDLEPLMVRIWREGRDRKVTVIAGTQQPANVPSAMYDQPTHLFFGRMADARRVERLGEIGGDREMIETILPELTGYEFLYLNLANDDAFVIEVHDGKQAQERR